jgi:hypothetical protein
MWTGKKGVQIITGLILHAWRVHRKEGKIQICLDLEG